MNERTNGRMTDCGGFCKFSELLAVPPQRAGGTPKSGTFVLRILKIRELMLPWMLPHAHTTPSFDVLSTGALPLGARCELTLHRAMAEVPTMHEISAGVDAEGTPRCTTFVVWALKASAYAPTHNSFW